MTMIAVGVVGKNEILVCTPCTQLTEAESISFLLYMPKAAQGCLCFGSTHQKSESGCPTVWVQNVAWKWPIALPQSS